MKKAIFVHIPKCAGCSLWKALLELNLKEIEYFGHGEAKLKKPFPYDNSYKNYFSFSFVRNPFDRLVSAFFFFNPVDTMTKMHFSTINICEHPQNRLKILFCIN